MRRKAPTSKNDRPPRTKDVFKLFAWYKKKWDRQAKEWAKEDEREKQLLKRLKAREKARRATLRKSSAKRKVKSR